MDTINDRLFSILPDFEDFMLNFGGKDFDEGVNTLEEDYPV
jgi:hypothetical protein